MTSPSPAPAPSTHSHENPEANDAVVVPEGAREEPVEIQLYGSVSGPKPDKFTKQMSGIILKVKDIKIENGWGSTRWEGNGTSLLTVKVWPSGYPGDSYSKVGRAIVVLDR